MTDTATDTRTREYVDALEIEVTALRAALHGLLAVENVNWPAYVRQQFAAARKVLGRVTC